MPCGLLNASSRLLICGLWVRFPPGSPHNLKHLAQSDPRDGAGAVTSGDAVSSRSTHGSRDTSGNHDADRAPFIIGEPWPSADVGLDRVNHDPPARPLERAGGGLELGQRPASGSTRSGPTAGTARSPRS
jgi:hypothetical protein